MKAIPRLVAIALAIGVAPSLFADPAPTAAADFTNAQPLEIDLSSFSFSPARIVLKAGQPYALTLINTSSGGHNFAAPQFFTASTIAPQDSGRINKGKVELGGGASTTIHLIPKAGTYKLTCTHFAHSTLGMTGQIVVR